MGKLSGSLDMDSLPLDVKEGSWCNAKNIVVNKKSNVISNEDGTVDFTPTIGGTGTATYPNKSVVGTIISSEDKILFFASTNPIDGEIGVVKPDGRYYPVIRDATSKIILNLNINFPVVAVAEKKYNNNTIIVFKDADGVPKILNIDCLPFLVDSNYNVISGDVSKAKATIRLFPSYDTPIINPSNVFVQEGQGALLVGMYYPIVSYELPDGSVTNWSKVYNGIGIVASPLVSESITITGGQAGDLTNKAINIFFSNVDINYRKLKIGYLYLKEGQVKAYEEKSTPIGVGITTISVLITGNQATEIDLDEVLIPNVIYNKVDSITTLQKSLYIGGLEMESEFNYQTYANLITIEWTRDRDISINGQAKTSINTGTYQNPTVAFFSKSFKGGECYAYYITFKLKNGLYTKAFHIPGRNAITADRDIMNPDPLDNTLYGSFNKLDGTLPIHRYQVLSTATNTSSTGGLMGFWENEGELYPVDPNNPTTNVHPDFANIPGVTFSNRKVRHHVFPDLNMITGTLITGTTIDTPSTYPVNDLKSKPLGIIVSNVNIPTQLFSLIDSWEIHYAERNNANIRVLGSDCASSTDGTTPQELRFQQFDLMVSKPSLPPRYIKELYRFTNDGITVGQEANFVEGLYSSSKTNTLSNTTAPGILVSQKIKPVNNFSYLGENTTIPFNNSGKSDNIYLTVDPTSSPLGDTFDISNIGVSQYCTLCDICIYRRNVYLDFNTQTLISIGIGCKIVASGIQSPTLMYGGDVYINRHSVNPLNTGTKAMSYICESAANIGYRNEDISQSKYFSPKYSNPTPSWYGYNIDFNAINKFNQIDIYFPSETCADSDITIFPNRIAYSIGETTEGVKVNWRNFKLNAYHESVADKGPIWNLLGSDRTLYIHHKYSLFIAEIKDSLKTISEEISLGVSAIFDRPPQEVIPESTGFAGTQSKFSCISCRLGYCFVDKNAGKIFVYQGKLREISSEGLFNFFKDNSELVDPETDNPFIGKGYLMTYDSEYNRLLVTKSDLDTGIGSFEFTLSYSIEANNGQGGWVSFHDYIPNVYLSNRTGLFGIDNSLKKVFNHNNNSVKSKYYNGVIRESYIDYVSNPNTEISKNVESVSWITNSEKNKVNYPKETFTHIVVYNDTQCSGKVSIALLSSSVWYSKDVRNVEGSWNFNNFRDLVKNITLPIFDEYGEVITSNIDTSKPWYNSSKFLSKYIIFRVITNNSTQHNLHLSYININFKKSTR